jgi:hypothetical protein
VHLKLVEQLLEMLSLVVLLQVEQSLELQMLVLNSLGMQKLGPQLPGPLRLAVQSLEQR